MELGRQTLGQQRGGAHAAEVIGHVSVHGVQGALTARAPEQLADAESDRCGNAIGGTRGDGNLATRLRREMNALDGRRAADANGAMSSAHPDEEAGGDASVEESISAGDVGIGAGTEGSGAVEAESPGVVASNPF